MAIGSSWRRKKRRVHVLGAGPAGLLAAHAAVTKGYEVEVFSKPDISGNVAKSDLYGCQYLHAAIPGITGNVGRGVRYLLRGSVEGYRAKVYGDRYHGPVSPDEYGPEANHLAINLRNAYNKLFDMYYHRLQPAELNPVTASNLFLDPDAYVLSTIPAPALCRDMENHRFASQEVWAMGSGDPRHAQLRALPYWAPDMTVECNGERDTAWYRAATVFGYSTIEWPGANKPPIGGVARVSKPLSTDCRCWVGERTFRLGRFGKWQKGVLVHTAYFEAMEVLP
jgi:hypothetical protein